MDLVWARIWDRSELGRIIWKNLWSLRNEDEENGVDNWSLIPPTEWIYFVWLSCLGFTWNHTKSGIPDKLRYLVG